MPMVPFHHRREFLTRVGGGFASLALLDLLGRDRFFARGEPADGRAAARIPAKATRCVFLFMNGAPSQVDTFDPKPALTRYHGRSYTGATPIGSNGRPIGNLMQTPFTFRKHGQSGLEISSLFP